MNDNNGSVAWTDTEAGQHLQARLNEQKTVQAIDHLLDRVDTLEQAIDRLTTVMQQGPGMVSMAVDIADEKQRQAAANGVDLEERLHNALVLAEKLTSPEMVDRLNKLFAFSQQLPGLVSMAADMADEKYWEASQHGVDIEERLGAALKIAEKLTTPDMVAKIDHLIMLSNQFPGYLAMMTDVVDDAFRKIGATGVDFNALASIASAAGQSLTETSNGPETKTSAFGMIKAMRDPDRQRGLGFFMSFLKYFGQKIK